MILSLSLERLERRRLFAASLVSDIDPSTAHSFPYEIVAYGGRAYFPAEDVAHGRELWTSDGTPDGTRLVNDASPGPAGIYPRDMTAFGGLLYFIDANFTDRLYRSDGTADGSYALEPNVPVNDTNGITPSGSFLYFTSPDRRELWRTDGTAAGTLRLATYTTARIDTVTDVGGTAFFRLVGTGYSLGRSDGTPGGTKLVHTSQRTLENFEAVGGRLFFEAWDAVTGDELWVHDPASGETRLVTELSPGPAAATFSDLTAWRGDLYFTYTDAAHGKELWRSDGTAAGTTLLKDVIPGTESGQPRLLTAADNALYFVAERPGGGEDLWRSDGTESGTRVVAPVSTEGDRHRVIAVAPDGDGTVYFATDDARDGDRLWRSDGTPEGTSELIRMPPGTFATQVPMAFTDSGRLVFMGNDGLGGREPWTTDGTPAGTRPLGDLNTAPASSSPTGGVTIGGLTYFKAHHNAYGPGLWRTDGTAAGTRFLAPFDGVTILGHVGDTVFLGGNDATPGGEIWRTDGTPEGTSLLKDLKPGSGAGRIEPHHSAVLGGSLYFLVSIDGKWQLWTSDGRADGTALVGVLRSSVGTFRVSIVGVGHKLFIDIDGELWVSDGTAAGTAAVAGYGVVGDGQAPPLSNARDPRAVGDRVVFAAWDAAGGDELWTTDGTGAGTRRVLDVRPGPDGSAPQFVATAGDALLFLADDGVHGRELWRTDGTPGGTTLVRDATPGPQGQSSSYSQSIASTTTGAVAYFAMNGTQLWRSDGTDAGTFPLPLPAFWLGTPAYHLVVAGEGDTVYFRAEPGVLWRSDGTSAGTVPIDWQTEEATLFDPRPLGISAEGRLLYAASSPEVGYELFELVPRDELVVAATNRDILLTLRVSDGILEVGGQAGYRRVGVSTVKSVRVVGSASNDYLTIDGDVPVPIVIDGGAGSDLVIALGDANFSARSIEHLRVRADARVTLLDEADIDMISVEDTATLALAAGGATTLRTRSPSVAAGATIDLKDNALVWEFFDAPYAESALHTDVASARNSAVGRWRGPGITSSLAAGEPLRGIAVGVSGEDVVAKYAWNGDANLDGRINADDYFRIDQGFLAQPQDPLYAQGDFNYDGAINADDYFLIDQAFLGQGRPLASRIDASPLSGGPLMGTAAAGDGTDRRRALGRPPAAPRVWEAAVARPGNGRRVAARAAR